MNNAHSLSGVTVAVCGAGAMGAGIAQIAAQAGHTVLVLDTNEDALARGRAIVGSGVSALAKRGKIDEAEANTIERRIKWTLDINDLSCAGLTIEAIVENSDVKRALYEKLEVIVSENAVIATNTSSLPITSLANGLKDPTRFLGLHFFNPAPIMKLVEVISGPDSNPAVVESAVRLMERWRKKPVLARDVPGFIVNRVARPFYSEGWRALEEGAADAATLDFLYRDLAGFRMGPFQLSDLIGHDVNFTASKSIYDAYFGNTRFRPSLTQEQLISAGRLGRKIGCGVFDYTDTSVAPAPQFVPKIEKAESIVSYDSEGSMATLLKSRGVAFNMTPSSDPDMSACAEVNGGLIAFSDGRTAQHCAELTKRPFAVLDWIRDGRSASTLAFAASNETARKAVLSFASALDLKAVELSDRPGLVVFRTLAQLANCAADAVRDRVASAESIDEAMMYGVNYPFGPLNWAKQYGFSSLCRALENISETTGDAIYKPCEILRKAI